MKFPAYNKGIAAIALVAIFSALAGFGIYSLENGTVQSQSVLAIVCALDLIITAACLRHYRHTYAAVQDDKRYLEDAALALMRERRDISRQEHRMRRILDNATDAYISTARDGHIERWNAKAADLFGWDTAEVLGVHISEVVDSAQLRASSDGIAEIWEHPSRFDGLRVERTAQNRDKRLFPIEISTWVDDGDDDGTDESHANYLIRDITQRRFAEEAMTKALEDERQAVARLEELDKVKTSFVSSISHEFRSPLTSTLGSLEILSDGETGTLTETQLNMVHIADATRCASSA